MTDTQPILTSPFYHIAATLVFIGMAFVLIISTIASFHGEMSVGYAVQLIALYLPSLCYLAAIWSARRAFKHFSSNKLFDETLPKTLRNIGLFCTIGSMFHLFGQAAIIKIFNNGYSYLTFDAGAIALMSIGVILIMLARLCERALLMKQHLFEIV